MIAMAWVTRLAASVLPSGSNTMDDYLAQLNYESEHTEEYADLDEPWDELLAQQELEDFEQCDEYFGFYGGNEDW